MTLLELIGHEIELTGMNRDDVSTLTDIERDGMDRHIHFLKTVYMYLQNPHIEVKPFNPHGIQVTLGNN